MLPQNSYFQISFWHLIALGIKSRVVSMISGASQVLSFFIYLCHALAPAPMHC